MIARRRLLTLAAFAVACHWQAVFAQTITAPDSVQIGQPIEISVSDVPKGSRLLWEFPAGFSQLPVNQYALHGWANVGVYDYSVIVAPPEGELKKLAKTLTVTAVGPAPPTPPPVVVVKTLAELAGDKAAGLAAMYAELLAAVSAKPPLLDDVAHFQRTEAAGLVARKLIGHGATAEISKRLNVKTLAELKAPLAAVVKELGASPEPPKPVPPVVVPGKRHVVILHETEDQTPALGSLFNELRTGPSAKTLKDAGHTLDILDDELRPDLTGVALPAMYVLDPTTKAVLYSQPMPATAPEILGAIR